MNTTLYATTSQASRLALRIMMIFLCLCCLWAILAQPSYAKERIRYHINGPDGSTLRVVDEKGIAVAAYRYAPFGEQLVEKQPHNLHGQQGFVSGIHESNDLVYLKHRYYNPRIGRFYQPDPVTFLSGGMGQINRYQYGWNDPLTFKDPSGLETEVYFMNPIQQGVSHNMFGHVAYRINSSVFTLNPTGGLQDLGMQYLNGQKVLRDMVGIKLNITADQEAQLLKSTEQLQKMGAEYVNGYYMCTSPIQQILGSIGVTQPLAIRPDTLFDQFMMLENRSINAPLANSVSIYDYALKNSNNVGVKGISPEFLNQSKNWEQYLPDTPKSYSKTP